MNWKHGFSDRWHSGQLFAFSGIDGQTSYQEGLVARTTLAPRGLQIVDPDLFQIGFAESEIIDPVFGGDWFRFTQDGAAATGLLLDAHHLLLDGDFQVAQGTASIAVFRKGNRVLVGTKTRFLPELIDSDLDAALRKRRSWIAGYEAPENLPPRAASTLFRALTMMKSQIYAPEGRIGTRWSTPDRWPHKDMWLWDSGFHAIGFRHLDPALARELIEAMFYAQREDGFIPHRVNNRGAASDFTQPPVLALAAQLVNQIAPDPAWIAALYPKLCAYIRWDLANRDVDGGGLAEWFIEEDPVCRSGESGMDNSPRFDSARPLDAVDFNAFLAMECEILARFADLLGLAADRDEWARLHGTLCRLINERLWSEEHGLYCDFDPQTGRQTEVLSSAGFLPLLCGAASPEQARRLAAHLSNPSTFGTAFPIPSIAASDTAHYSKDMWRGPTWICINWLVGAGLERYGLKAEAERLRSKTVAVIESACDRFGTFFEYFDDRLEVDSPGLLRKGICDPSNPYRQVIHEFGWTATLYVDLIVGKTPQRAFWSNAEISGAALSEAH